MSLRDLTKICSSVDRDRDGSISSNDNKFPHYPSVMAGASLALTRMRNLKSNAEEG